MFATGSDGTRLESHDGGVTWVAPPSDRGAILDAGDGFVVALQDDEVLGSADGDVWIELGDPPYAPNEVGSVRAAGDPRSGPVLLTGLDHAGVPTVSTAVGGAHVVAPWRDTAVITSLEVGSDGTAMVLTAAPPRPSKDPPFALAIWTRPPAGQIERTEVAATPFTATGTARDICTAAGIAVNGTEFEGVVLDDITTRHDGTELRWLACTGDEAFGWGVTVLTSRDDSTWQMAALGLGNFAHAGDGADTSADGGTGWVRYRSMATDRLTTAWSVDGGTQWVITAVVG